MKKRLGITTMAVVTTLFATLLMGCGNSSESTMATEKSYDNVIIVAGNHANSIKPDYTAVSGILEDTVLKYGNIDIIVADGDPFIALSLKVPEQKAGLSNSKKHSIARSQVVQLEEYLNSSDCMAKTPEVDLLSSFELVSRILGDSEHSGESTAVLVFDSGLNTSSPINMSQIDLNTVDVEKTVRSLKEQNAVYNLSECKISWYGMSDVAAPQEELASSQKEKLAEFWKAYFATAGSEYVIKTDISTDKFSGELPDVTPVISKTPGDLWSADENDGILPETVVYSQEILAFKEGTAEFVDDKAVVSVVEETSRYMKEHSDFNLTIVGCTAKWGDLKSYCIPLSEQRALSVKNVLVEQGINEDRIKTVGMGFDNPFYINDQDESGNLIENVAQCNRSIVMMDSTGNTATKIENGSWK